NTGMAAKKIVNGREFEFDGIFCRHRPAPSMSDYGPTFGVQFIDADPTILNYHPNQLFHCFVIVLTSSSPLTRR
ncbi:hypothetical protein, partial [Pantoea sp. PNT02]|uniref:hypothetical protein n=1 Tax=Pantoea sp. PNT02 TaxID=2769261 RepID=UPI001CE09322